MSTEDPQKLSENAKTLFREGRLNESLAQCLRVCELDRNRADIWQLRGTIHTQLKQAEPAINCFREAVRLLPDSADSLIGLVNLYLMTGNWENAVSTAKQLTRGSPQLASGWFMLGRAHAELNQWNEAIAAYRKAIGIRPDMAEAQHGLGFALLRQGHWTDSIGYFERALELNPRIAQAHWGIGYSLQMTGQLTAASQAYQKALAINPKHAPARLGVGLSLSLAGHHSTAVDHIRESIKLDPGYTNAYLALAATLLPLNQPDEAEKLVREVLNKEPGNTEAIALATTIEQHRGDIDSASDRLRPLLDSGQADHNALLAWAAICISRDEPERAIPALETSLKKDALTATAVRNTHFNLGKLYDKCGEFPKAFEHYSKGNSLKGAVFDPAHRNMETSAHISIYTREAVNSMPRSGICTEKPLFVVGMPRSGTSLIEQILASHPAVFGAGELNTIIQMALHMQDRFGQNQPYPQCMPNLTVDQLDELAQQYVNEIEAISGDAIRVVDKMPGNFMHLGLVAQLFPGARIIHSMRNPLDSCLSCYFQDFSRSHPYSYDLTHLGAFYKSYERIMQHWRETISLPLLEIQYEDLVADKAGVSHQMIEFCGLDWDDQCLDFHETRRYVATASYDQVRRPLYNSSVERWKHYADFIAPLREALK